MHIYIDESGGFQGAGRPSCVGAVIIPDAALESITTGFAEIRRGWPSEPDGEIKGKRLAQEHFALLCEFLEPHQVIFECFAMCETTTEDIARHLAGQATGMTSTLTEEHQPTLVREVLAMREYLQDGITNDRKGNFLSGLQGNS